MPARRLDPQRLELLRKTNLLDAAPDEAFDRLTRLASKLLGVPVSLVSLVDEERQFFFSQVGLGEPWASARETPLSHSFCQFVVEEDAPLVVPDAREDEQLRDNLAIPDLGVIAYAGMPIRLSTGEVLGSFCAIDSEPRSWANDEVAVLQDLANAVVTEIELRLAIADLATAADANRRRTLAVNSEIVQALTTAKLALEKGHADAAAPVVAEALDAARRLGASMADLDAFAAPGSLRTEGASG